MDKNRNRPTGRIAVQSAGTWKTVTELLLWLIISCQLILAGAGLKWQDLGSGETYLTQRKVERAVSDKKECISTPVLPTSQKEKVS